MPSPIPVSSCVPNISNPRPTFSYSESTSSLRSQNQKLRGWKTSPEKSNLTEAKLVKLNRRNEEKYAGSSPYYKGLLYFSPDSDTSASVAASFLNAIIKFPGLRASCFKGTPKHHAPADPPPLVSPSNALDRILSDHAWIGLDTGSSRDLKEIGVHIGQKDDLNSRVSTSFPIQDEMDIRSTECKIGSAEPKEGADSGVSASSVQDESETGGKSRVLEEIAESKRSGEAKPLRERVLTVPSMKGSADAVLKEKEFVWAEKYRPSSLNDFICNRDKAEFLQNLVTKGEGSHFIFEGQPGVGKRTMVRAFLIEAFGPEKLETKEELRIFRLKGQDLASIKVNMKISSQHVEINLPELCGYEKDIIVALMESHDTASKLIVLRQAERLSSDAQLYIRWTMERYKGRSKIAFCCSDASKLQPVRSVCTHIQLLPPSKNEIVRVLEYIADQEGLELPHHLAERIAENSKQNLRQAIRSFEASWQSNYPFKEDHVILTGWEEVIAMIAKSIISEQSPKQLYVIRGKLQNLIDHNISPDFIFSTLVQELKKHLDAQFHPKIDAMYLEYNPDNGCLFDGEKPLILLQGRQEELSKRNNVPLRKNVHHFMRIEEFTAKFMSFYKGVKKV